MEILRVSVVKYYALMLGYMILLPLAVVLPIFKIHYSTTGDVLDVNVYTVLLVAFFWAALDLFILKGAKKPICVQFSEDTLSIETRFVFRSNTEIVTYEKAIVSINQKRIVLTIRDGQGQYFFTSPLWGKRKREVLQQCLVQKEVQLFNQMKLNE